MYTYIFVYIYICKYIYTCVYVYVCMYIRIHIYVHTYKCSHVDSTYISKQCKCERETDGERYIYLCTGLSFGGSKGA